MANSERKKKKKKNPRKNKKQNNNEKEEGTKRAELVPKKETPDVQDNRGQVDTELFFDLFGNDIRRKILSKLAKFPRYASDLAVDLGVSKQATKKHLDKLLEYGLIKIAEKSKNYAKKQFYQIADDIALFFNITLMPNYYNVNAVNTPEDLLESVKEMDHDPRKAVIYKALNKEEDDYTPDYEQLDYSLRSLGKQLTKVEKEVSDYEERHRKALLKKTMLINRIQIIINALLENELEKEVISSFFFDLDASVEGLSLEDIVNRLFLKKKKRAGVSKFQDYKPDEKTLERGQELLELLKLLVKNFEFIRTDGKTLFFDFDET